MNDISLRFFGLLFCCRQYSSLFNHSDIIGPKPTEIGEIKQNEGHYAVQGYSRSPILVPMESLCATSYIWLILTYILSRTVSKLLQIIGQSCTFDRGYLSLTHSFGVNPEFWLWRKNPSIVWCWHTDRWLFVLSQRTRLSDRRTDREAIARTRSNRVRCALKRMVLILLNSRLK